MQILMAGSSGFLGQALTAALTSEGHQVARLVRRTAEAPDEVQWDPYAGQLGDDVVAAVEATDVVVNLAGVATAGNPHSKRWQREMLSSRVATTDTLARAIAGSSRKPVFLAQNAVGFYGDHGPEVLTEDSGSSGDSLLTQVARAWQQATTPAVEAGARVVVLRTAPVLDKGAAPLQQMILPFRLGLGARLGDGRQHFACISLRDWIAGTLFLLHEEKAEGPFNLCCPDTPTNAEFTEALASALGRKARLAAPAALLRRAAGAAAPELLGSLNVRPAALEAAGFEFRDRDIRDVVAAALA
jgi:uncharacterized protein (TIGR01777 family)